ncbi:MAG: ribonuclease Y [Sulfurimonas sp.]|uniref:ribonuclease Y n=1 Tax=Sulfurimonas sp. TaxID=2022749 RepID=UPI00262ACE5F|nr:ribonuclease Y [Sulfurimonas sp.]MCW8894919.1 ribonuclease Y [Sulfurimonas sp.]MCW8954403.1 ribonuclease Y [Sulfurimonas sp.]MCW9068199.1 ribonuclease Y [Sulfurimonas sp.]
MLTEILMGGFIATVGGVVGFFVSKKITNANFDIYVDKAKAHASAIENEAHILLSKSNIKAQEIELEATKKYENAKARAKEDLSQREDDLIRKEQSFKRYKQSEERRLHDDIAALKARKVDLQRNEKSLESLKKRYEKQVDEALNAMEHCAGMTTDEAKSLLLEKVEEKSRADIAHIVRKYENEAKQEAKKKANYILAQATSRFAGDFASERLTNLVHLNDDELKGRIIGKEGRNIKALETLLGVDIIIDDTPNAILVSSFNLYRRAIATKTIQLLIEDGRIQPARIEEIYTKVCNEFEDSILNEGEELIADMDIGVMHPELVKLIGKLRYRASYGQNALAHTLEVAHLAGIMAAEMGGDVRLAKRAGLLHDIGKALTHDHDGNHVDLGADICNRYNENSVVINAIYAHHGHEEINSIECGAVCAADALSAARPGARREVLESFLKRVTEIEEIASEHTGVKQAYAINAGREVRVLVNASLVNDDESVLMAREIAKEIEEKVQYPGEIKVNVIRESRAVEFAK